MTNMTSEESTRFQSKYRVIGQCWVWGGPLDRDGYGSFYLRGATRRAHRVAWFDRFGEIPSGYVVNHTCRNRGCVNPQHLQCITAEENALKDSTSITYINSQKTTCPNGHPFDKVITSAKGRPQRICTICDREVRSARNRQRYVMGKATLKV